MSGDVASLLVPGIYQTLYMVAMSGLIGLLLGLPLCIILVITDKGNVLELPALNKTLGTIINVIRSFPSIILIVVLLPLSRLIVGTTLGTTAAIVPLSIGSAPFIARIIENSLKEVENGKIEAALAMGASPAQIIRKVLLPEALPSLVRGITIAIITIIDFTAVAGSIGAGGLGSLAIQYGYLRFRNDILFSTVLILIILVQSVQLTGEFIARYINRKRYKFD